VTNAWPIKYSSKPGAGNLRHACHIWHTKQFSVALKNTKSCTY